jgi:hypothetical protein
MSVKCFATVANAQQLHVRRKAEPACVDRQGEQEVVQQKRSRRAETDATVVLICEEDDV